MDSYKYLNLIRHGQLWTQREEYLVRSQYPTTLGRVLAVRLGRTERAVATKAGRIGIRKGREMPSKAPKRWSDREIKKLRKLWLQEYTIPEIAKTLGRPAPGTKNQLRKQIKLFGLKKRFWAGKSWSKKDLNYLTRYYETKTTRQLSKTLGRSIDAIRSKAERLDLMGEMRPWTAKESNFVKKYYKKRPTVEIAEKLDRTDIAIRGQAGAQGLSTKETKWSDEEIKTLRRLWQQGHSMPEIARQLDKKLHTIQNQITRQSIKYGLKKRYKLKYWTKKEDAYLVKHYRKIPPKQIAKALKRTRGAVITRATTLKLTKPRSKRRK